MPCRRHVNYPLLNVFPDVLIPYQQTRVASAMAFSTQAASFLSLTVCHTLPAPNTHSNKTQHQKYITIGCFLYIWLSTYYTLLDDTCRLRPSNKEFPSIPCTPFISIAQRDGRRLASAVALGILRSDEFSRLSCSCLMSPCAMTGCGSSSSFQNAVLPRTAIDMEAEACGTFSKQDLVREKRHIQSMALENSAISRLQFAFARLASAGAEWTSHEFPGRDGG